MLFARSDVCAISIPTEAGGCGAVHSRPVTHGAPAKVFKLTCEPCERYLRGDRKPKILKYQIDKNTGQSIRQERISDGDPAWGPTQDTVPLTPDEERTNTTRSERGAMQIQMLQALAAIRQTGIDVPPEAMWLLEREIPEGVLKGTVLCANQHDNAAGVKYCSECGIAMNVRGAIGQAEDEPVELDLGRLAVPTLKKLCREKKLDDHGGKDVLIKRLEAA